MTTRAVNQHDIDYEVLVENYKHMCNVLEFDSMRSPGKAKMNSQHLHSMLWLIEKYEAELKKQPKAKVSKEG